MSVAIVSLACTRGGGAAVSDASSPCSASRPRTYSARSRSPLFPGDASYREQNRQAWAEYETLNAARVAAMFALDDAKQRHQEIRGSSRFVDHAGDVEEDETAPARGAKATRSVAVLEEQ